MVVPMILLLVGFAALIKGADVFVTGSSAAARLLNVPSVIIGLTIVAMGTSAPEAAVSITASLSGSSDIALGNVIGSNIFNLLVVLGVCALIRPVPSDQDILTRDSWWNIGATVLLLALMADGVVGRGNGLLLLAAMACYLFVVIRSAIKNRSAVPAPKTLTPLRSVLYILLGLGFVILGGQLVVNNACILAAALGMSETLISLTIIAIGTSLPELVTSITAAHKGDSGLALGNVIGSNLFNILFILGASTAASPIAVTADLFWDTAFLLVISGAVFLMTRTGKQTNRWEGLLCLAAYLGYIAHIILR